MARVFIFVLDSLGIGASPDADKFGDVGANTLKRISESEKFCAKNLIEMGLCNLDGVEYLGENYYQTASTFRMKEKSMGKDTTTGHWEMMGAVLEKPFPTYPDGFPNELIEEFSKRCNRPVICNKAGSGTDIIKEYGEEHLKTGALIVYTSQDSVFQIAAHTDICPVSQLYNYCKIAREITDVGRVIARPFTTKDGEFVRTPERKDFSIKPPKTYLDDIKDADYDVISVGKISDIFASQGITQSVPTHSNIEGMRVALKFAKTNFSGLCFVNLVDFDMKYGHRQDIDGYAEALSEFDKFLPKFMRELDDNDIMIITADHGCDPGDDSTDHTREYTPLIIYGKNIRGEAFGTLDCFCHVGKTATEWLGVKSDIECESILPYILR